MIEKINKILSEWDPIEVGYPLSLEEYKKYSSKINMLMTNENELRTYIIKILNEMGLNYNHNDSIQKKDIDKVVQKILRLE